MPELSPQPTTTPEIKPPGHLSAKSFLLALAILLAIFSFLNPIWKASEIREWDENIWWSYAPIPLVAGVFLAFEKKLALPALFLESMKLSFVKFAITFIASNLLWTYASAPSTGAVERETPREQSELTFAPGAAPAATDLSELELVTLIGVVEDGAGRPVEGALVRISSGLEEVRFSPPSESLQITRDGAGFSPKLAIIEAFQLVEFRSETDALHTAVLSEPDKGQLLNFPVLPRKTRKLMFDRAYGLLNISCSIHGQQESTSQLLIVSNPFHVRTNAKGDFRFDGVPSGEVVLSIRTADSGDHTQTVRVSSKPTPPIQIRIP